MKIAGLERAESAEAARMVFELRLTGRSMAAIAEQLGKSEKTCYGLFDYWIEKLVKPSAEAAREVEIARLDRLTLALDEKVRAGDVAAIAEARMQSKRRSELLGLNIPVTQKVQVSTTDAVDEAIMALVAEHDARAKSEADS